MNGEEHNRSDHRSTFVSLAVLVIVPVFLAIVYGVFKRRVPTRSAAHGGVSATPSNPEPISN